MVYSEQNFVVNCSLTLLPSIPLRQNVQPLLIPTVRLRQQWPISAGPAIAVQCHNCTALFFPIRRHGEGILAAGRCGFQVLTQCYQKLETSQSEYWLTGFCFPMVCCVLYMFAHLGHINVLHHTFSRFSGSQQWRCLFSERHIAVTSWLLWHSCFSDT